MNRRSLLKSLALIALAPRLAFRAKDEVFPLWLDDVLTQGTYVLVGMESGRWNSRNGMKWEQVQAINLDTHKTYWISKLES